MFTADHIIMRLGGSASVARKIKLPMTTVASWKAANFIPEWRQPALIALAKGEGFKLLAKDFPPQSARKPRLKAAPNEAMA